jgi:hypothetical protein
MLDSDLSAPLTLFELRRYRTRPGRRDELIAMFEAHFRPAYEAAGAIILASWTVPDEPDRWVWIRAFTDAAARRQGLERFYSDEVWAARKVACGATLADASDVRVLRARQAGELAQPLARDALPVGLARTWSATVLPLASAVGFSAPTQAPGALELVSGKALVLLRRFETPSDDADFHAALRGQPWPRGAHHWRLAPTACSLLR